MYSKYDPSPNFFSPKLMSKRDTNQIWMPDSPSKKSGRRLSHNLYRRCTFFFSCGDGKSFITKTRITAYAQSIQPKGQQNSFLL